MIAILVVLELVCAWPPLQFLPLHIAGIVIVGLWLHLVCVIPVFNKHTTHIDTKSTIATNILHCNLLEILNIHILNLD